MVLTWRVWLVAGSNSSMYWISCTKVVSKNFGKLKSIEPMTTGMIYSRQTLLQGFGDEFTVLWYSIGLQTEWYCDDSCGIA